MTYYPAGGTRIDSERKCLARLSYCDLYDFLISIITPPRETGQKFMCHSCNQEKFKKLCNSENTDFENWIYEAEEAASHFPESSNQTKIFHWNGEGYARKETCIYYFLTFVMKWNLIDFSFNCSKTTIFL